MTRTVLRWARHPDFPDARRPERAHPTDAGADVFSAEAVTVARGEVKTCRTGLCVHPEPIDPEGLPEGYGEPGGWTLAALVWDKSGLAGRGLTTLGGVIDDPYTGEVLVVVANVGKGPISLMKGEKLTQLVVQRVELALVEDEPRALAETDRGAGGFSSTGM